VVELRIPCRPEFVGIARLAILGVASRMPFTYDEVEDIRLAVGEACTTAVKRATRTNQTGASLTIRSEIIDAKLTIEIIDDVSQSPAPPPEASESVEKLDDENIGALLMELLVDEIKIEPTAGHGTRVQMIKYAGQ
jgi:serine/threonine-protein kinase RsbW